MVKFDVVLDLEHLREIRNLPQALRPHRERQAGLGQLYASVTWLVCLSGTVLPDRRHG